MLVDFFTKPLLVILFHKFRYIIMGYKHIATLLNGELSIKGGFLDPKTPKYNGVNVIEIFPPTNLVKGKITYLQEAQGNRKMEN